MSSSGWHDASWKGILAILRGDKTPRPPIGYLPDRGKQKQRNHRWLGAAWWLLWLRDLEKRDGLPLSPTDLGVLSLVYAWAIKSIEQEIKEGLGVHAGSVEIFMPDPHAAYEILPRIIFLTDVLEYGRGEILKQNLITLWRWQIYGWKAGSTPDGQVVLPCTRLVTPLSQVTDACNRILHNSQLDFTDDNHLAHRDNKWKPRSWKSWFDMFKKDPLSQMWAAEYFRQAIDKYGVEKLFQLTSRPQLEPPLLAWPISIRRSSQGHYAEMFPNDKYNGIAPCYQVEVSYKKKSGPTDGVDWQDEERIPAKSLGNSRMIVKEIPA